MIDDAKGRRFSRRGLLAAAAGALVLRARGAEAKAPETGPLIARMARPPQLETPVAYLDEEFTPNPVFFVRSHFDPPAPALFPEALKIDGAVAKPLSLSARDWSKGDVVQLPAVLQCSGNGRALYPKKVPGIQWEKGAVGQAKWGGVRLAALLERAGLAKNAKHVILHGTDTPPHPNTPAFLRSIPIERAMDPTTIVAFQMNGQALPHLHGGPLRLVVPGWAGNHWMKWLAKITVSETPATGFFMDPGYMMPVGASETYETLTVLPVKSWITRPIAGTILGGEAQAVRGQALSGAGPVEKVEVSFDSGKTWREAKVEKPPGPGAWQRWSIDWKPPGPGTYALRARATDSTGAVQPEVSPPNRSGYLWNGWDAVACEVRR
jgi:sulfite oxidase